MAVTVLFLVSISALIGAAFLYFKKDSNDYAAVLVQIKELRGIVDAFPKDQNKSQIEEIWNQFAKQEQDVKRALALGEKADQRAELAHTVAHNSSKGSIPQKVVVEFMPLNVKMDKVVRNIGPVRPRTKKELNQ